MLLMLWFRGPFALEVPVVMWVVYLRLDDMHLSSFLVTVVQKAFFVKKIILIGMGQPPSRIHHPFL